MNSLIFLSNNLQSYDLQKVHNLKLTFVCHALARGKMYRYYKDTVIVQNETLEYKNKVIYGSVYNLDYPYATIDILDALHDCTRQIIGRNHDRDLQHRIDGNVIPIVCDSYENLLDLKYEELNELNVLMYIGNPKHPKIAKKIHDMHNINRIMCGFNDNLKGTWEE